MQNHQRIEDFVEELDQFSGGVLTRKTDLGFLLEPCLARPPPEGDAADVLAVGHAVAIAGPALRILLAWTGGEELVYAVLVARAALGLLRSEWTKRMRRVALDSGMDMTFTPAGDRLTVNLAGKVSLVGHSIGGSVSV
jgi:hypothetical protein